MGKSTRPPSRRQSQTSSPRSPPSRRKAAASRVRRTAARATVPSPPSTSRSPKPRRPGHPTRHRAQAAALRGLYQEVLGVLPWPESPDRHHLQPSQLSRRTVRPHPVRHAAPVGDRRPGRRRADPPRRSSGRPRPARPSQSGPRLEGATAPTAEGRVRANVRNVSRSSRRLSVLLHRSRPRTGSTRPPASAPYQRVDGRTRSRTSTPGRSCRRSSRSPATSTTRSATAPSPTRPPTRTARADPRPPLGDHHQRGSRRQLCTGISAATDTLTETARPGGRRRVRVHRRRCLDGRRSRPRLL